MSQFLIRANKVARVASSVEPREDLWVKSPVVDSLQDYPAGWSWKIILIFTIVAACLLYWL